MKRLQRFAIVVDLIEKLRHEKSWCGETHVQKATYFLQELLKVPLDFEFVLYKHGPFSFDLSDELTAMRADNVIAIKSLRPNGPKIMPGPNWDVLKRMFPKTLKLYESKTQFVAKELAQRGVKELERLATALYVKTTFPDAENAEMDRAWRINNLKPHIAMDQAYDAIICEERIAGKARELVES